ncbi:MAG: Maf family nucleotide pyrophosphatase [Pseudomonadota bacterium]
MTALILASASASRNTMLSDAGIDFFADPADLDEASFRDNHLRQGKSPTDLAVSLAIEKARSVCQRHAGKFVLGSDQILIFGDELISKVPDREHARELLWRLRGQRHQLISAAAFVRDGVVIWSAFETADMYVRSFSEGFLESYLDHAGEGILGSVGCYHLEGLGAQLFDRIEGDFFTVLGLPLIKVLGALREHGVCAS